MATATEIAVAQNASESKYSLDQSQTLRASKSLLNKISRDQADRKESGKASLLDDADDAQPDDETPVWLVLTTKKHIVDKKRLKPGKILLPHPYLDGAREGLRICLITADPQRKYKDLVAAPAFPLELSSRITRVLGLEKLKSKYKSYETRRQLFGEYDVFLADDRIITLLPNLLGKVFYKGGSKRPIPVSLEGKRQNIDEAGNRRKPLREGGSKAIKADARPEDVAREIQRTLRCALVHLAPSTTTAVKIGTASQAAEDLQANAAAVVEGLVDRFVPQKWKNVRAVHIKAPETAALPIYMAEELWEDEQDVLDELPPKANEGKKRKRSRLADSESSAPDTIEVPGPDGQLRVLKKPSSKQQDAGLAPAKKRKSESTGDAQQREQDKADKAAHKEALRKQKESARAEAADSLAPKKTGKRSKA